MIPRSLCGSIRSSALYSTFFGFPKRWLLSTNTRYNGNFFGEITKGDEAKTVAKPETQETSVQDIIPRNDQELQSYYLEEVKKEQISSDKYINPLKRKLFNINVEQNGFFKNNQIVRDIENKKLYKLELTPEEIEIMEPSIYLQSYRIKSSMKKATHVNRFVRGFRVKNAINQLHFSPKKMATELEKLLKKGLEQGRLLLLDPSSLYIHALWVGSDGDWRKRVDPKSRGRAAIINHRYVHLKTILKTDLTLKRIAWEKQQKILTAKPNTPLNSEPLNFRVLPYYKW